MLTLMAFLPEIILVIVTISIIVLVIKSKDERNKFKVIKFNNQDYFIVFALSGTLKFKSSNAVFFKKQDEYIFKCEYNDGTVDTFEIKKDEIENFETKQVMDANVVDKYLDYDMNYGATHFSGVPQGDFEKEKGFSYSSQFETKMNLKSGGYIFFLSKKNPQDFFN